MWAALGTGSSSVPTSVGHSGIRIIPNVPLAQLSSSYQGDWSGSHCSLVTPENTPVCRLRGLERDAQGGGNQIQQGIHVKIKHSRTGSSPAGNGQEGGICHHSLGLHC